MHILLFLYLSMLSTKSSENMFGGKLLDRIFKQLDLLHPKIQDFKNVVCVLKLNVINKSNGH